MFRGLGRFGGCWVGSIEVALGASWEVLEGLGVVLEALGGILVGLGVKMIGYLNEARRPPR
jgi:hypothetical protein